MTKRQKGMVAERADKQLNHVQEEQRKVYLERKKHFNFTSFLMGILFILIIVIMIMGIL